LLQLENYDSNVAVIYTITLISADIFKTTSFRIQGLIAALPEGTLWRAIKQTRFPGRADASGLIERQPAWLVPAAASVCPRTKLLSLDCSDLSTWERHMHTSLRGALTVSAVGAGLALFGVSQAQAFTLTFDEFGNCSSGGVTCAHTVEPDPSQNPLTSGNVLVFTLPSLTFTGNVNILDPTGAVSDRLRWIAPDGSSTECPTSACANRLIFYSFDSNGAPADVGPMTVTATTFTATEHADGTFSFPVPPPGVNVYDGTSSGAVPEPSTWAMILIGFAGLGFAFRQSRRKMSFA
jgi:hypothetical protein